MYFTPGLNQNELGDFDVIEHDGRLHLFYLSLPSHDAISHLVSDDGINWQPLPIALRTGDPGESDDDQLWTMGVFQHAGRWHMLYTANQNRGLYQVINLALSDDLIHWTKYENNPVIKPDPRWYEAHQHEAYRIDWRDPHVVEHNGVLHGFLCARENQGPLNMRGCAAYFTSTNGRDWQVQPPAAAPRNCYDYECPSVFELDGRFYMVAISGTLDENVYRVAEHIEGPYVRPFDDRMTPGFNGSLRPCKWKSRQYLFHWNRGAADWPTSNGNFVCLSSPKLVEADTQGKLVLSSGDWSCMHDGQAIRVTSDTKAITPLGIWAWQGDSLAGSREHGLGAWLLKEQLEDFELTCEVTLNRANSVCELGIAIRADNQMDTGIFATLDLGLSSAKLVKRIHSRPRGPHSLGRGQSILQSYGMKESGTTTFQLRLIAFGPNIELNVNGRLVLSHLTLPSRSGYTGLFIEDGAARFSNIQITRLHEPRTQWCW